MREVIKTLGGWPVLDENWQPPTFTLETLLGRLRSDYSEPILIELYVGADDKNSSAHIIQVRSCKGFRLERVENLSTDCRKIE